MERDLVEQAGGNMTLQQALAKAARPDGIPPKVLADIQETLGPMDVAQESSETNGSALELDSVENVQVIAYVQAASTTKEGWADTGYKNSRAFRTRVSDDTGIGIKRTKGILFGLEEADYIELAKKLRNGSQVIENARLTEQGELALNRVCAQQPDVVAKAEEKTTERLNQQIEYMRDEVYHASDYLDMDRPAADSLGAEMTVDLGGVALSGLLSLPMRLGAIQEMLKKRIDFQGRFEKQPHNL